MTSPIPSSPISLLRSEIKIVNKRLFIGKNDKKGVSLVSELFFEKIPKETLWNKILKFIGIGYWVVLKVHENDDKSTYLKVNGNSLRKFSLINPKDFKHVLKGHPDLDVSDLIQSPKAVFQRQLQNRFQNDYELFKYQSPAQLSAYDLLPLSPFDADNFLRESPPQTALIHLGIKDNEWMLSCKDQKGEITHRRCDFPEDKTKFENLAKGYWMAGKKKWK